MLFDIVVVFDVFSVFDELWSRSSSCTVPHLRWSLIVDWLLFVAYCNNCSQVSLSDDFVYDMRIHGCFQV